MSQNPLYYSGSQTSKPLLIKPALSAALASLEVKLDEELSRYRRTRIIHRTPIQKSLGSLIAAKPQAQTALTVANTQNQQSLTGEQAAAYIKQQQANSSLNQIKSTTPPAPVPETSKEVVDKQKINSQKKQIPFINEQTNQQTIPYTTASTGKSQTMSPQNESSIVKADMNLNTQEKNLSTPQDDTSKQPEDYLESSEALLRSLAEEQPSSEKPTSNKNNDSLRSPLSIGAMLLLLLSSITFGYIVFNLDNNSSFSLSRLFKGSSKVTKNQNTTNPAGEPELTPIPKNPNLASDVLPDINNIDDVAGATPESKPTKVAKPAPPETATTVKQISPTVAANTPTTNISESEAAPATQNLDEIQPTKGGYYNVIVDNTGDTLNQMKKVIPDAYLSPEGKYVYLGAFKSKERVKKHLEVLKQNGITARVEEPE